MENAWEQWTALENRGMVNGSLRLHLQDYDPYDIQYGQHTKPSSFLISEVLGERDHNCGWELRQRRQVIPLLDVFWELPGGSIAWCAGRTGHGLLKPPILTPKNIHAIFKGKAL